MPWDKKDYPNSLKNFMAPVRNKAIEIANALLAEGNDEQKAIAIATAKAEEWAHAPEPENPQNKRAKKRKEVNRPLRELAFGASGYGFFSG